MNKTIDTLLLSTELPTEVSFRQVYSWVLWQFPQTEKGWFRGAVHPPIADYGWLPAFIDAQTKKVQIFAQIKEPLASPEEVKAFFERLPKSGSKRKTTG